MPDAPWPHPNEGEPVIGPGYRVLAGFIAIAGTMSVPLAPKTYPDTGWTVAAMGVALIFAAAAIFAWELALTGCAAPGTKWRCTVAAVLLGVGAFASTAPTLLGLPPLYQAVLAAAVFLMSDRTATSATANRTRGSLNLPLLYALPLTLVGFPGQPGWHGTLEYVRVFSAVIPLLVIDVAWAQLTHARRERPVVGFRA
jgi:hypothetical protein